METIRLLHPRLYKFAEVLEWEGIYRKCPYNLLLHPVLMFSLCLIRRPLSSNNLHSTLDNTPEEHWGNMDAIYIQIQLNEHD